MQQVTLNQAYTLDQLGRDIDVIVAREDNHFAIVETVQPLLTRFLATASSATIPDDYCTVTETGLGDKEGLTPEQQIMRQVKVSRAYRGANDKFVIMVAVWPVGCQTGAHDHAGTWVVEGGYLNRLVLRKFRRIDDRTKSGFAELEEVESSVVGPGDVGHVLSPDREIHDYSNPYDVPAVTVNIYGSPDPVREVCNYFDLEEHSFQAFAPFDVQYYNEVAAR